MTHSLDTVSGDNKRRNKCGIGEGIEAMMQGSVECCQIVRSDSQVRSPVSVGGAAGGF